MGNSRDLEHRGRRAAEELARAAIVALEEAELTEELALLNERVFGACTERLFEATHLADGRWDWGFRPIVELLLHHVRDVASNAARPLEDRGREILWAISMSGF